MNEPQLPQHAEKWSVSFFVKGIPAPGGSKRAFVPKRRDGSIIFRPGTNIPVVNITDDAGVKNKNWRKMVSWTARQKFGQTAPLSGPCIVEAVFFMPRPLAHFRKTLGSQVLKPDAPEYHITRPDALKLARSTEDAMTGIVYADDGQTVRIIAEKRYCNVGQSPGCIVTIRAL